MEIDQPHEQKLTAILLLLNPPQQDYETLADKAWHFLDKLPSDPSVERVLATYFELFASGYAHWQQSYDYPRIHQYFYGAFLQAKKIGGNLFTQVTEMLEQLTKAMIAYTNCENALINNDPQGLLQAATRATTSGKEALTLLSQAKLESSLTNALRSYLEMNSHLWQGFAICAQGYLDAQQGKELSASDQRTVEHLLQELEKESQELFSELNAHYSFVQRQSQFRHNTTSSLLIKQGELFLRAIGYVGEKEVSELFKKFNQEPDTEQLCKFIHDETGLPIESMRASYLMDIFETVLGKKYLDQIVFDFAFDGPVLAFKLHTGAYQPKVFRMNIARFGTISVEIGIPLQNVSLSHVRTLESLIGPHAGRLNIVWKGVTEKSTENFEVPNVIDFVEYFLLYQEKLSSLQKALPKAQATKLAPMHRILGKWEDNLCELSNHLPRRSANTSDEDEMLTEESDKIHLSLQADLKSAYEIVQSYLNDSTAAQDPVLSQLRALQEEIFAEENTRTFGRLMDISELIIIRMQRFLEHQFTPKEDTSSHKRTQETIQLPNVRYLSAFDCDTGWQSILNCKQIVIVEAGRKELKPATEAEYQMVLKHPEFKGFAIQPREARASVDDWIFVDPPKIQNLATIRSHENDVLYIGANKAFLWFPDDPQFLVNQYVETTRLIADIRTLVLTFNNSAKKQIDELEELDGILAKTEKSKKGWNLHLKQSQQELMRLRSGIEIFHIHAERVLDLLRACSISKFQDHSELLKRMLQESEAKDSQISLERNIENLGHIHEYLSGMIRQKIEERNQSNQALITAGLFLLAFLSALSVIPSLYQFLIQQLGNIPDHNLLLELMMVILVLVIGCCIVIGLIVWQRSRNI